MKGSPYLYVAPFFVIFGVFGAYPLVYTLWVSLHDWPLGGEGTFTGLENFRNLLADDQFWNSVYNTLGMFVVSTVPQLIVALILANALNQKIRFRGFFRMSMAIPIITSTAAVAIVFGQIFNRDFGIVNWGLGLVGVEAIDWRATKWASWIAISAMVDWRWTGYNTLIYLASMQSISKDLYESASLDGASKRRQFWSITIPMLRPTIIFTVIISTIGGLQLFAEPLMFTSGSGSYTGGTLRQYQTVTMYLFENVFVRFNYGYAAAVAWMLFLLIVVIALVNYLFVRRINSAK
ncbi:MAG TPA: sugar ABC transporter permease [Pilimelia sp.]|nr:sugar ABC transporter permease [Pilimelia sp.]